MNRIDWLKEKLDNFETWMVDKKTHNQYWEYFWELTKLEWQINNKSKNDTTPEY